MNTVSEVPTVTSPVGLGAAVVKLRVSHFPQRHVGFFGGGSH